MTARLRTAHIQVTQPATPTSPCYHLYGPGRLRPAPLDLRIRTSQPGLPAWWRLAAPALGWVRTLLSHLSWALSRVCPPPAFARGAHPSVRVDFLPPRGSLATLSRGPMARKKQSRVQLLSSSRVLQFRVYHSFFGRHSAALGRVATPADLWALLHAAALEQRAWISGCISPLAVNRITSQREVYAPLFLLWA